MLRKLQSLETIDLTYSRPKRMAVIDVGSNSFRLIVMDYVPGTCFQLSDEIREVVRLGSGLSETKVLRATQVELAVNTMKMYAAFCKAARIDDVRVCATEAVRLANNHNAFLNRVRNETGLEVRILSGEEEAYYGYLAAVNSTTLTDGFAMDLGGGSLEITRIQNRQMRESVSLPLGAIRATEDYLTGDPIDPKSAEKLDKAVRKTVAELGWFRAAAGNTLIGQGGTLRNLAHIDQQTQNYPLDELHGYHLSTKGLKQIFDQLLPLTVQQKRRIPGMKDDRADITTAGCIVIRAAVEAAGFDSVTICHQGMREGVFYEHFLQDTPNHLFEDVRRASIYNLANLYHFQQPHAEHVAKLALQIFDQIPPDILVCTPADRELLWAACILHDIGVTVDYNDHHKHSFYLVLNAGLPGFNHRELVLIALMTRFHRKGPVTINGYGALLEKDDDQKLLQMTACLRLAEQLDRSRDGVVHEVRVHIGERFAQLELLVGGDGVVAEWSVLRHADFFSKAFDKALEIVTTPV